MQLAAAIADHLKQGGGGSDLWGELVPEAFFGRVLYREAARNAICGRVFKGNQKNYAKPCWAFSWGWSKSKGRPVGHFGEVRFLHPQFLQRG